MRELSSGLSMGTPGRVFAMVAAIQPDPVVDALVGQADEAADPATREKLGVVLREFICDALS